jgi:hypothetical protein
MIMINFNVETELLSQDITLENEDNYDGLIVGIEANQNRLNILIAIGNCSHYRDEIIKRYQQELDANIWQYNITLKRDNPSLKQELLDLREQHPELQTVTVKNPVLVTVTGAEQLEKESEQDIFCGYLQWNREGLREFPYTIVLWINEDLAQKLNRQAADFWSWRNGVFHFNSLPTDPLQINLSGNMSFMGWDFG